MKLTTRIAFLFAISAIALMTVGKPASHLQSLRVRIGDRLSIHIVGIVPISAPTAGGGQGGSAPPVSQSSPTEPVFLVLSDGTIESHDFGTLPVVGLTLPEVTKRIHDRLAIKFKNPIVSVVMASQAPNLVFVSGVKGNTGVLELVVGEDLRQLISGTPLNDASDLSEAHVFRAGRPEVVVNVHDVLQGTSPFATMKLEPNDVISVMPIPFIRVWVTGEVEKPGQIILAKGGDLYQAVASAGGPLAGAITDSDSRIALRRGPDTSYFPVKERASEPLIPMEAGDTVVVTSGNRIHVTVSGEVKTPGTLDLRTGALLDQAIAGAGGLTPAGTGRDVAVLRDGKTINAAVASSTNPIGFGSFMLQDHDVVLVKQNTAFVIAVGYVQKQGRVYIADGQVMHLIDVVGEAGGIAERGTSRHVFVGHPDKNGSMNIREVRLDRYLKDGDAKGNPVMVPGDIVTVQPAQTPTLEVIQQVVSGALILYGVSRI